MCLTKLDVLDGLEKVCICTGYQDKTGNAISVPFDAEGWEEVQPIYEEMPGWTESTVGAQSIDALPQAARDYIARLEELVGAPVDIVSTGPDRVETIILRQPFA